MKEAREVSTFMKKTSPEGFTSSPQMSNAHKCVTDICKYKSNI